MLSGVGKFIKEYGFPTLVAVVFAGSSWILLGRLNDAYKKLGEAEARTQAVVKQCLDISLEQHRQTRAVVRAAVVPAVAAPGGSRQ